MVWLAVAVDQALVRLVVAVLLVAVGRAHKPIGDLFLIGRGGDGKDPLRPVADLGLLAQVQLGRHRAHERCCQLAGAGGAGPVEGSAEVGPELAEAGDSFDLGRADEQVVDVSDLLEAPLRVPLGNQVGGAGFRELLGSELAHGFQQPEEPAERTGHDGEHRLLDQVLQQVVDVDAVEVFAGGHAASALEVERAGEHRQPLEQRLLGGREQVVGPLDGRPKGPVTFRRWFGGRRSGGADGGPAGPPDRTVRAFVVRAAASSIARGTPSRRRQISSTSDREAAASNVADMASARSLNSSTAGPAGSRGPTAMSRSPLTPSASRDVASTRTFGHRSAMAWTSSAAPSMTCSQLSSTRRAERDCRAAITDWVRLRPGPSLTSRTSATARGTSLDEAMLASSISHTPPTRSTSDIPTARASRVLPIPPGPTSVTTGECERASPMTSRSFSRP